mmetsp:Transcript_793/g.2224  ORF Transcript_793/g.2224 Transcript_793/m.2224 type:complete len:281 (-) Transcript_793:40-882(-)
MFPQRLGQHLVLVVAVDDLHELGDVRVALELLAVPDLHLVGPVQEVAGQLPHPLRPRRREEHRVAPGLGHLLEDLADLRLEAHVEHPVGLVQDELGDLGEVHLASLEEVVQAPRRGDEAVDPLAHLRELHALRRSAVGADRLDAARHAELLGLLLDLHSQLARRGQHQEGRVAAAQALVQDVHERREEERDGLAAPGGCDANDVMALQRERPRPRLDLRRLRVATLEDLILQTLRPRALGECLQRLELERIPVGVDNLHLLALVNATTGVVNTSSGRSGS